MKNRERALYEQYLMDTERSKKLTEAQQDLLKKQSQEKSDFFNKLNRYRKQKELDRVKKVGLEEAVYNDMLGTALKAIYITSLGPISERAEIIANNNVESYIKENGGAKLIIRKNAGKTALLDSIFEFVNDATEAELHNFDIISEAEKKAEEEIDDTDKKDDIDNTQAEASDEKTKNPADNEEAEEPEPTPVEDDQESEEPEDKPVEKEDQPQEPEAEEEEVPAEEPEKKEKEIKVDDLINSKEDLFNKMEKEDDINAAVDLISQRVQDAEAEFIKKNAQDKKKIEKIITKLGNRIDGATDQETADAGAEARQAKQEEQLQQEATRMIKDTTKRYHSVFEEMVKDNANYIMKNNVLRESYIDDGQIDMASIVESTKVMYGFLEFVNTMKLENADEAFIKNVLEDK